jgi:hypothetical protein
VVALALLAAGTASGAPLPSFQGCPPVRPEIRPAQIVLACADGNFYFTGLDWSAWNASGAQATGTAHQNDCTPNCAAGHFHSYGVSVKLSRREACARGRIEFTRLHYTLSVRPRGGGARSSTVTSPFAVPSGCP